MCVQTQSRGCEEDAGSLGHAECLPAGCWCWERLGSFLFKKRSAPTLGESGGEQGTLCLAVVPVNSSEDKGEVVLQLKGSTVAECP